MIEGARLRGATRADATALRELVFGVLREYGLEPDPAGTDADLDDVEVSYRGGIFDVVEDSSGRLVGSVGLHPIDAATCELRKMYLAREVRGRGLGRNLLEHALARARALGFRRVVLETATVLSEAIALYRRYGFERYVPAQLSKRCNEAYALDLADGSGA